MTNKTQGTPERPDRQSKRAIALQVAFVILVSISSLGQSQSGPTTVVRVRRQVVVSIPDRKLAVIENRKVLRTFKVSVGAAVSPSPTGKFEIVNRLANPTYYHAGVVIPAGKNNPLGPRWVGLNKQGYGIHGTSAPASIGKAASHGCIRMHNRDVVEFATLVNVGDTVEIRGERDEEMGRIFGSDMGTTVAAAQTTQPATVAVSGQ
jgi:lipoprotein-anchoring transpeptidase ErfK/SrfK